MTGLRNAIRPALIITRREIRDTLRDWRIVIPIVTLVVTFPLLANLVADRGIAFVQQYGGDLIIERLYPFLMLVVGFFPSTFSLVIGLETFVGEKERRSLEPLLTTPLTDFQLYLGKLLAATVPPILASYLGMFAYIVGMWFTQGWAPSLSLGVLAFGLATVKAVLMVSAAVVVSSQSTSVRAANLVASFIIVPMALLLQVEAGLLLFAQYTALWLIALALVVVTVLLVRLGIRLFSRENLLGRDLDELDLLAGVRIFWQALWPRSGLPAFYREGLPALLRGIRPELAITVCVLLVGGFGLGGYLVARFPLPLGVIDITGIEDTATVSELVGQTGLLPAFSTWAVLLNNVRSLLLSGFLGLLSLGAMALMLLMAPMVIIAYIALQVGQIGLNPWLLMAVAVLPHGILELPAAILATAQAMRVGDVILAAPAEDGTGGGIFGILREVGHFVKLFVLVVLPLLAVAAWIEVHVTPRLLVWYLRGGG
ncbi:MAG: stage II sporulation protein M [Anaerolineae bacterium]|nr:stage II sporulation protein M [Anaerolineae bacterium]